MGKRQLYGGGIDYGSAPLFRDCVRYADGTVSVSGDPAGEGTADGGVFVDGV